jgi:hypothetical protein
MASFARLTPPRAPLVALAVRWDSEDLYQAALRGSEALKQLGVDERQLVTALNTALIMWRKQWQAVPASEDPQVPDVICADDEPQPYVSVRLPVPFDAEQASALTWALNGMLIEKKLDLPGLSLGFVPAQHVEHQARRAASAGQGR